MQEVVPVKKHTYRTQQIQNVHLADVLTRLKGGCIVGVDVAKAKFFAALATLEGTPVTLLRFEHPTQTRDFLQLLQGLMAGLGEGEVKVAMEPTGTYGDAVRYQVVTVCRLPVLMVSPKRTHDSQELFDGVRSLHDAKSAVLVARLCAMGLASEWKPLEDWRVRMRALVEQRAHQHHLEEACLGRLEGLLARHWPEFGRWLDLREHRSALSVLSRYGCPVNLAASGEEATAYLNQVSRGRFSAELREGVSNDARTTLGVPTTEQERRYIQELAMQARDARIKAEDSEGEMHELGRSSPEFTELESWMGTFTAATLVTFCPPSQYRTANQLEKACGLNLREKSSGEHQGRLMLTKRGPGVVRRVMYLFALRTLQSSPEVHAWYLLRQGHSEKSKKRARVAVSRRRYRRLSAGLGSALAVPGRTAVLRDGWACTATAASSHRGSSR